MASKVVKEKNTKKNLPKADFNKLKKEIVTELKSDLKDSLKNEISDEIKAEVKSDLDSMVRRGLHEEAHSVISEEFDEKHRTEFFNGLDGEIKKRVIDQERALVRIKNWAIFRRDIIIILLLALSIFFAYYWVKDNYITKEEVQKIESVQKEEEEKVVKDDNYYLTNYSYLFNYVKTTYNNNMTYYLYSSNFAVSDIRNDVKLNMAFNNVSSDQLITTESGLEVKADVIDSAMKTIFGNIDYTKANFVVGCNYFIYHSESDSYISTNITCNDSTTVKKEEILKISEDEKNETITVETVLGIYDRVSNSLYKYNEWYTPVLENINESELDIKAEKDKLTSYKYTFKKDSNNNYHLVTISKNN